MHDLTVGSLFSGVGGFDLGFERAGFRIAWQAEIDPYASRVLAHRWPNVPNLGDVREIGTKNGTPTTDVICGGFPCQDVSVAGLRAGLSGERSGLWFEFLRILRELRPRWVVIENVPGLLSSQRGRDFAVILRGLVECGYGVTWRIIDAQYRGVAQRRRRLFVVGSLGNGRSANVLFEPASLCGHPAPSRETGEGTAGGARGGARDGGELADCLTASMADSRSSAGNNPRPRGVVIDTAGPLGGRIGGRGDLDSHGAYVIASSLSASDATARTDGSDNLVIANAIQAAAGHHGHSSPRGDSGDNLVVDTLRSHPRAGSNSTGALAISRRGRDDGGSDEIEEELSPALRTGGGRSSVSQIIFDPTQITSRENRSNPPSMLLGNNGGVDMLLGTLTARQQIALGARDVEEGAIQIDPNVGGVRRLTPVECERLQGFPDGWTDVEYVDGKRTKRMADTHRYKQMGNAVCVPVAYAVAERIIRAEMMP